MIDEMKNAVEAMMLEAKGYGDKHGRLYPSACSLAKVIERVLKHKPIAWMYWHTNGDGTMSQDVWIGEELPEYRRKTAISEPAALYAWPHTPFINVSDEQLIDEVRKRGFIIKDAKICAKWNYLTDEEVHNIIRNEPLSIFRAIEYKVKEKNS